MPIREECFAVTSSMKLVCSRCRVDFGTPAARAEHETTCTGSPPAKPKPYHDPYRPTERDHELVDRLRVAVEAQEEDPSGPLSDWERNFVRSIGSQVKQRDYALSTKQREIAERIVDRLNAQAPVDGI